MALVRGRPFADVDHRVMPWVESERWEDRAGLLIEAAAGLGVVSYRGTMEAAERSLGPDMALLSDRVAARGSPVGQSG